MMVRKVLSTASMQYLTHITISSHIIKWARRIESANLESIGIEQTLSSEKGIDILNTECAALPPSKSDTATAEVATAIALRPLNCNTAWTAAMVHVFPVPPGAPRKSSRDLDHSWLNEWWTGANGSFAVTPGRISFTRLSKNFLCPELNSLQD